MGELTIIERERILIDAARRYIGGEISLEDMTAIRDEVRDHERRSAPRRPRGGSDG